MTTEDSTGPARRAGLPARRRSPLAMTVLALLYEAPMHVYRMHRLIRERAKDDVVNVGSRNSIHQAVERLVRDGLVRVHERDGDGRGRTVYALTDDGEAALRSWLADAIATPRAEYPELPAALSYAVVLGPHELAALLARRLERLEEMLTGPAPEQTAAMHGLVRVLVLEDEYRRAVLTAERDWVRAVLDDLRSGALAWSEEQIRALAQGG